MKESEAREKWCPFVRVAVGNELLPDGITPPFNRVHGPSGLAVIDEDTACIASKCAVWVEDSEPPITKSKHGHCGLAK